jgi:neutral ceramidase
MRNILMGAALIAGAASADITPKDSQFLFGYPHVRRYSTGVHDPLLSSALFLADGKTPLLMIANDVIYVGKESTRRVRKQIERETGVPAANIMITATHTHSGPLTVDTLSNEGDPAVPKTDPNYVERFENGVVQAGIEAYRNARPAEIGFAAADGSCVGGNRHDPAGPSIPEMPVVAVRDRAGGKFMALMLVCSMHPTVLHEDSTLLSGDFPAMARQYLQKCFLGMDCPIVHHTGPCGNQSPRHVTRANTFEEAERLGHALGQSVANAIRSMDFSQVVSLTAARAFVELPRRSFPSVAHARELVESAIERLNTLHRASADHREVRTAECDWFGSEETLALADAAAAGRVDAGAAAVMPAEIQIMCIGPWSFVGWPGEIFVEFPLMLKASHPNCRVISMANGELQGYLVTEEAMQKKWYEAMNSLFSSPEAGMLMVEKTMELLRTQGG